MTWEPVQRKRGGVISDYDFPVAKGMRSHHKSTTSTRLYLNPAARALFPGGKVIYLRNGSRMGIRAASEDDVAAYVRPIGKYGQVSATGFADPGTTFRLIPKDDVFFLEPM